MTSENSVRHIAPPERFHKITGVKGDLKEFEDQAWSDLCALIDGNYPDDIYGYFPVYILWDIRSTTHYGESVLGGTTVDRGQIYGKQASGALIIAAREIRLMAKKQVSQKFPAYPPFFSKAGLVSMFLSSLASQKAISLSMYDRDLDLRLPLDGLKVSMQSHVSLRNAIVVEHPERGSLRIEGVFSDHEPKIVGMLRDAQKEYYRQEQQKAARQMAQNVLDNVARGQMADELAAIATLRDLNPEAYEAAVRAITKKHLGNL